MDNEDHHHSQYFTASTVVVCKAASQATSAMDWSGIHPDSTEAEVMQPHDEKSVQSNPERSTPVSDWKSRRLKVGHHIRNNRGQIGVVTWVYERNGQSSHYMYRLGTRDLNAH